MKLKMRKIGLLSLGIGWLTMIIGIYFNFYIHRSNMSISTLDTQDLQLAVYLNDQKTSTIPTGENIVYDETKSSCTNGAYIIWDYESWSPVIKNMSEYKTSCNLYFKTKYTESILNGTDPIIKGTLLPVTIASDGTVTKADLGSEWYNYENKQWANAVILFDDTKDYLAGETIPESEIESYFVWIPKYRYQLWNLGLYDGLTEIDTSKVHTIPVIFGDYNTSDNNDGECTTPMTSGTTGNCAIGDYMTHPAFISIPSIGFWVGKFKTGYNNATSTAEAEQNINDSTKVIIKPNVYSWRGIQVANAFYNSYNYQRDLESHMMKNTEWGAVAYLQHSAYGSATSVRINNNSDYMTGYAALNEPTCGYTATNEDCNIYCNDGSCNTAYPHSITASTTGNTSGVFDMSGGAWEYVMGIMLDETGNPMSGRNNLYNSGFNGSFGCFDCDDDLSELTELTNGYNLPESKYYDLYLYNDGIIYNDNIQNYNRRILGDATGEMGPFELYEFQEQLRNMSSWYSDHAHFVSSANPIFARGGYAEAGYLTGIFAFEKWYGSAGNLSYRLILTPTNVKA